MVQKTIVALVVTAAFLAPAASARPIDAPGLGAAPSPNAAPNQIAPVAVQRTASGANPVAQSRPVGNSPTAASPSSGFRWADAGIGAAGMLVVLSIAGGTVLAVRRSRDRGQPAPIG